MWSGVPEIDRTRKCEICAGSDDIKHRQIPIDAVGDSRPGEIKDGKTESYIQTSLCKSCSLSGWTLIMISFFRRFYSNLTTGRSKTV